MMHAPEHITIEVSRIMRGADNWAKWFRFYEHLIVAGKSEADALAIVEAAQADERADRRKAA